MPHTIQSLTRLLPLILLGFTVTPTLRAVWTLPPCDQTNEVTAIDICIEPGQLLLQHAVSANARLRAKFPDGFALDQDHTPHITLLQRYVKTSQLEDVYKAVEKVLASEQPHDWKLNAFQYDYVAWGNQGLAAIVVERTDQLLRCQSKLIDAVRPFTVSMGTVAAFVTTPQDPEIDQPTIDYVASFVPQATNTKYRPHVTIGVATEAYVNQMNAQPLERFSSGPRCVSVFHLGNFGTARTKLKSWVIQP